MARGKESNGGCLGVFGVVLFLALLAAIPWQVWAALAGIAAVAGAIWLAGAVRRTVIARRQEKAAEAERAARAQADELRRHRVQQYGEINATWLERALAAVQQVAASEAARAGWLGDVDFSADLAAITAGFDRSAALRARAADLQRLDSPGADDRRLLAEALAAADRLDASARGRAELVCRCAVEAGLIDRSLEQERADARTAEERAALHRELSAMLYGIEAVPESADSVSAADRVMARVAGYRELKQQIARIRE